MSLLVKKEGRRTSVGHKSTREQKMFSCSLVLGGERERRERRQTRVLDLDEPLEELADGDLDVSFMARASVG